MKSRHTESAIRIPAPAPVVHSVCKESGMTLMELLLVIVILSSVAWVALAGVENNHDQLRFENTHNRREAIRRAIIGRPEVTVNGLPGVAGYSADMGELPAALNDLLIQGTHPAYQCYQEFCSDPAYSDAASCTGAGETWIDLQDFCLWAGWNGPYLNPTSLTGTPEYRDGWGHSFAYTLNGTINGDSVDVQSLGRDNQAGGTGYDADYPDDTAGADITLVAENQWAVLVTDSSTASADDALGGIQVDFGSPASCWRCSDGTSSDRGTCEAVPASWYPDPSITDSATCTGAPVNGAWQPTDHVCLEVATRSGGKVRLLVSSSSSGGQTNGSRTIQWDGSSKKPEFIFEGQSAPGQFDQDTYLPEGWHAFRIVDYDTVSAACTHNPVPAHAGWSRFLAVPGIPVTLTWQPY